VAAALGTFGLAAVADRLVHFCSAGQKRRVGLARLLLAPRRLWLLDEPTVALDDVAVRQLAAAVRAHCAGGGMAVIATHAAIAVEGARTMLLEPLAGRASADPFLAGRWG
jgi:heme exporter protein A